MLQVREGDDILIVTTKGKLIRMHASGVKSQGRNTMGVRIIDLDDDDKVGSIARVDAEQAAGRSPVVAVLDIKQIRDQPDAVERALAQKGGAELITQILVVDADRRRLIKETEDLKALRNRASEAIGQAKRKGEDASAEMAKMREVADRVKNLDGELKVLDERVDDLVAQVPNLPHPSVPPGTSDADNVEVRRWGTPRTFDFTPKPHEEIGEALGLLDSERAVKLAKSRFTVLWARRGAPVARARPVHAGPPHARARLHGALGAAPGERRRRCCARASCRSSRSSSSRRWKRMRAARST